VGASSYPPVASKYGQCGEEEWRRSRVDAR